MSYGALLRTTSDSKVFVTFVPEWFPSKGFAKLGCVYYQAKPACGQTSKLGLYSAVFIQHVKLAIQTGLWMLWVFALLKPSHRSSPFLVLQSKSAFHWWVFAALVMAQRGFSAKTDLLTCVRWSPSHGPPKGSRFVSGSFGQSRVLAASC